MLSPHSDVVMFTVVRIGSIEWLEHTEPQVAGELSAWAGGLKMHPDAASPGGNARPKVDVRVQIDPAVEGVPVYLQWRDVDDPSDDDGPIDDDPDPPDPSKPDEREANPADNFATPGMGATSLSDASPTTDANGQVRVTLDVGAIQPGNNFRVAASLSQSSLSRVLARSADFTSDVFYDENGDGISQREEPLLYDTLPIFGCVATPLLTLWRYLHVEVDSMWEVQDNTELVSIWGVEDLLDGRSELTLYNTLDAADDNRFEGGELVDSSGISFTIESNTTTEVIVYNQPSGTLPAKGPAEMYDDDHLRDLDEVPEPDMSEVASAMAEAFVDASYDVDNGAVDFEPNRSHAEAQTLVQTEWDSHGNNSIAYWQTYVIGAFQGDPFADNDPIAEGEQYGYSPPAGGGVIYLETIKDGARQRGWDATLKEQDTVVHELGHAVSGYGGHPCTKWEATPSRYTEDYLKWIRQSPKPTSF